MLFKAHCAWLCSTQCMASSPTSQGYENDGQKDGQVKTTLRSLVRFDLGASRRGLEAG